MADLKFPRINKVILSGRVTNDVELRYTPKGTPVVRFTLAFDRSVKDATGQFQNQASFLEIVAWSKWAETLGNSAHKGSPLIVEGHLETRSYTDSNNVNRKAVEVIAEYIQFLEFKPRTDEAGNGEERDHETHVPEEEHSTPNITNDDVPF